MKNIRPYLSSQTKVFLVGIGGVSMSALAEILKDRGLAVSGSDRQESEATKRLRALGVAVAIGESPQSLEGAQCVIRTAAARDDNPLIAAARARGVPVFERADAWGAIMTEYPQAVCVAGTHGKTSTTSMLTHIAVAAGRDPTVMIGGTLPLLGAGHRVGKGGMILLESCEYCNSFLKFTPSVAVVLNVESDHLDFFTDLDDIISSFCRFCERTVPGGQILVNGDDDGARRVAASLTRPVVLFGRDGTFRLDNIQKERGCYAFDVMHGSRLFTSVRLSVPGVHNMQNALAAAAAAQVTGMDGDCVRRGLESFHGAARRMQYIGTLPCGAPVYDDYAHHPSEIRAALTAVRDMGFSRILCAFQPHTYTRTAALFGDFVSALGLADLVYLADIYAARECATGTVSSEKLAAGIENARYADSFEGLAALIRTDARPGDVVLTMGAGNIDDLAKSLLQF